MTEILHADIFFFITALAVVCVSIALIVVLFYVGRIVRDLSILTTKLRSAGDQLEHDVLSIRENVINGGLRFGSLIASMIGSVLEKRFQPRKKKTKKKRKEPEEE
jgi:hypothetical protein